MCLSNWRSTECRPLSAIRSWRCSMSINRKSPPSRPMTATANLGREHERAFRLVDYDVVGGFVSGDGRGVRRSRHYHSFHRAEGTMSDTTLTLIRKPIGRVIHAYRQGEIVGPYRGTALCGARLAFGWGPWEELEEDRREYGRPIAVTCLRCAARLTEEEKKHLAERPGATTWKPA